MKAWILHNPNNMTYEETEKPQPKSDEVLVAVKAAGICGVLLCLHQHHTPGMQNLIILRMMHKI